MAEVCLIGKAKFQGHFGQLFPLPQQDFGPANSEVDMVLADLNTISVDGKLR